MVLFLFIFLSSSYLFFSSIFYSILLYFLVFYIPGEERGGSGSGGENGIAIFIVRRCTPKIVQCQNVNNTAPLLNTSKDTLVYSSCMQ